MKFKWIRDILDANSIPACHMTEISILLKIMFSSSILINM